MSTANRLENERIKGVETPHFYMAKNTNTVCLSDESLNDWGYRVLTVGIDLSRFEKNPVLLKSHCPEVDDVIGRVENIRIEDGKLYGDLVFDVDDPEVAIIAGKWDRGFLNAVSIGFTFDYADMVQEPDGTWTLKKCQLYELSVVAMGSNQNAVKLYSSQSQKWLDGSEIIATLSSGMQLDSGKPPQQNMAKITLSTITLASKLGFSQMDVEQPELEQKINELLEGKLNAEALAKKHKEDLDAYQTAELSAKKQKAESFVQKLIKEGKLKASDTVEVENMKKLAEQDISFAESIAAKMAGKSSLSSINVGSAVTIDAEESFDYLQKHDPVKLASIRDTQPDLYAKLASEYSEGVRYKKK